MLLAKYEHLYQLTKEGMQEELARFTRIEEKASRYLRVLGLLFVLGSFAGVSVLERFVPPTSLAEWATLTSALMFLGCVLVALLLSFSVMTVKRLKKIPITDELVTFYDEHAHIDIVDFLTRRNIEAVEYNTHITNQRTRRISWAYGFIIASMLLIAAFLSAALVVYWRAS